MYKKFLIFILLFSLSISASASLIQEKDLPPHRQKSRNLDSGIIERETKPSLQREVIDKVQYEMKEKIDLLSNMIEVIYHKKASSEPALPHLIIREQGGTSSLIDARSLTPILGEINDGDFRFSSYGAYFAWIRRIGETIPMQDNQMQVTFYKAPFIKLWEKNFTVPYDGPKRDFIVSDVDGKVVEVEPFRGILKFYQNNGTLIDSAGVFLDEEWSWNKGITGKFTDDGKFFVVQTSDPKKFTHGSGLIFFDSFGTMSWKFDADEPWGFKSLWVSEGGEYIVSSYHDQTRRIASTYLLNGRGGVIAKWSNATGGVVFSKSKEYVIVKNYNKVFLYQCATGEQIMSYSVMGTRKRILDMDISEELEIVAILEGVIESSTNSDPNAKFRNGKIVVHNFNRQRNPLWELELPDIESERIHYHLSLSENGEKIGLTVGSKFWVYQLAK